MMKKLILFIGLLFCIGIANAYAACPSAYPNNVSGTNICYLITAPGEYVAAPGAGATPCPIGDYCPGGDKIYNIKIPERYRPVEYLENNGNAYIDTGHIPTPATTVNADVMITGGTATGLAPWQPFLGTQVTAGRYTAGISLYTGYVSFDYFTGAIDYYTDGGNFLNQRLNFKTQIVIDEIYALFDNATAYSYPVVAAPDFQYGIYLFKMANDHRQAYGRFYFYQAYESDELVQYMIPVYDTESKLYGMYDMVSHNFFGSANSDKFTGGTDLPTSGGNYSCAAETQNEFISSPPKSETIADCGKVLHIGSNKIYMRRRKITPHALAARIGDIIFYAEMTTEKCGHLRTNLDGVVYSICNIGADD